jgi:YHS domain-containing protein
LVIWLFEHSLVISHYGLGLRVFAGYFALAQVLIVGQAARVRPQQLVRAELPTVARYFGLPAAGHFVTAASVPFTVTVWLPAARGDRVVWTCAGWAAAMPGATLIWLPVARGVSNVSLALTLRVIAAKAAAPMVVRRIRVFIFCFFIFGRRFIAPPNCGVCITPADGKSRKNFFEGIFAIWCIIDVIMLTLAMKTLKMLRILALTVPFLALPLAVAAADTNSAAAAPPKPDQLTTCPVSGEKLGEMGKPYVFTYQGQEVKLCCSGCKKDFDKDPAKYLKKIQDAAVAQK